MHFLKPTPPSKALLRYINKKQLKQKVEHKTFNCELEAHLCFFAQDNHTV